MFGTGYIQILYLGRAPRTKETLPDFRQKCRVIRHSRVFHGLTGSQRTPGFWGVTYTIFSKEHGFASQDSLVIGSDDWGFCGVVSTPLASKGGGVSYYATC